MNKNIKTKIALGIILSITLLVGGLIWLGNKKQEKNELPISLSKNRPITENNISNNSDVHKSIETKRNLFYATYNSNKITVSIFNTETGSVTKSKTVTFSDSLGPCSSCAAGNDTVQFNPQTRDIFFITEGVSGYDGSCINSDGTCFYRIHKFNIDDKKQKPKIIFQTEGFIKNWIVNPMGNSIIFGIETVDKVSGNKFVLKSVDLSGGTVRTIMESESGGTDLIISLDGKYIFQMVEGDKLVLNRINIISGDLEKIDIYNGKIPFDDGYVSPDGRYVAFYQAGLKIYDVVKNKLISHSYPENINNYILHWSGDGNKLVYSFDNKLAYFDTEKSTDTIIEPEGGYVYGWAPSNRYIIYTTLTKKNIGVRFYDTFENKDAGFNQPIFIEDITQLIVGINWF